MAREQAFGEAGGIDEDVAATIRISVDQVNGTGRSGCARRAAHDVGGGSLGGVDDGGGAIGVRALQVLGAGGAKQIEAQQQVGVAVSDLGRGLDRLFAEQ